MRWRRKNMGRGETFLRRGLPIDAGARQYAIL
jgi:hypothetical protein